MKKLLILLLVFTALKISAQDNDLGKRTTIVFGSSEAIADDNFGKDKFLAWAKAVQQAMGNLMKTETSNSTVKIIVNWVKGDKCSYEVGVCPANNVLVEKVKAALKDIESPVAEISSFQLLFAFKFNDGCNITDKFSPEILSNREKLDIDLTTQSLAKRKEALRNWALQEVIPVLAWYTSSVNEQFAGVRKTGEILTSKSFLNKQAITVTDNNSFYWRGVMEMSKGNLLISVSKVFMHVANDEFDLARRYIGMLYRFADKESVAAKYMAGLNNYLNLFFKYHDSLVQKGITFHDAGKYDKAIEMYNSILADYPNSAWARYELYFSTKAKNSGLVTNAKKANALWSEYKAGVYAADPLYPMGGGASNAEDAYILFKHFRVKELFKDNKKLKDDMIEYAAIALDLDSYAFAAHLYWYLLSVFPEEKYNGHELLAWCLYSLQKQGVTEVQSFFKKDYKDEFVLIDEERETAMKNDAMYKSFKEE